MPASDAETETQAQAERESESDNTDRIDLHPPHEEGDGEAAAAPDEGDEDDDGEDDAAGEVELFGTETMAELHARQGRLGEAIAIFKRLIERDPSAERHPQWVERCRSLERARAHTGDLEILSESPAPPPPPAPRATPAATTEEAAAPQAPEPPPAPTEHRLPLIINQPVRSGQVVYARGRDLIVLGSVNPGGQVVADGHIHVYGVLRGRAVAGAQGCAEARIFCQKLEAELLAINGIYLVYDDLPPASVGKPAQIEVQGGHCLVKPL